MKKLLIATTALVLTAGAAAAEVKLTGDARFGLTYNSSNATDTFLATYRARAKITMTGKTDGGLDFGASFMVNDAAAAASGTKGTAWIGGTWGKITVGDVDKGDDSVDLGILDPGFIGIGVDNDAEMLMAGTSANIAYTGSFGAVSVALSYLLPVTDGGASGDWSLGVGYEGDGFHVGLGYDSDQVLSLGGGATFGAFTANALYSTSNGAVDNAYGFDLSYKLNSATTIVAAVGQHSVFGVSQIVDYGVGVKYDLGGGATLAAGLGSVDGVSVGDVGLTFKF